LPKKWDSEESLAWMVEWINYKYNQATVTIFLENISTFEELMLTCIHELVHLYSINW
jgi:hypothetical protein